MHEHLLDYLLNDLDEPARSQLERRLQHDAELRRQLDLLRQALEPLAADAELTPPSNLAARTVARVAEHICTELPRAPVIARVEVGDRAWWRRADALVAASLLLICLGLGMPALFKWRASASVIAIAECSNNLREFFVGLRAYQDQHGTLPVLDAGEPAGVVVPVLKQAGTLPPRFSVRCPGHGPFEPCTYTHAELQAMPRERFVREAPKLLVSYAYSLGYRDAQGVWRPAPARSDLPASAVALLADTPPPGAAPGNSLNHGGRGQNVLYLDGHVRFATERTFSGDDLYLNRAHLVAAGLDPHDAVLGYSAARP